MERTPKTEFFHVLKTQQFDRALLDELCELTTAIRKFAKTREGLNYLRGLLAHKRAMLYFTQPSTRTFLSFNNACQILGIQTSEIRDSSTSSEVKGESLLDSLRTFSSYVDVVVMRTKEEGLAESAADLFDHIKRRVPIINAGSGKDQHPTQALLDIYTLERSFAHRGGIDGKTIAMMGDLKRGRTVRSLCYLMKNYRNVKLIFIAPDDFKMADDIKAHLQAHAVEYVETKDLRAALPDLDAIYITRIQDEHDKAGESKKVDYSRLQAGRGAPSPHEAGRGDHASPASAGRNPSRRGHRSPRQILAPGTQRDVDARGHLREAVQDRSPHHARSPARLRGPR